MAFTFRIRDWYIDVGKLTNLNGFSIQNYGIYIYTNVGALYIYIYIYYKVDSLNRIQQIMFVSFFLGTFSNVSEEFLEMFLVISQ